MAPVIMLKCHNQLVDSVAEYRYINIHNPTYKRDSRTEDEMIREALEVAEK